MNVRADTGNRPKRPLTSASKLLVIMLDKKFVCYRDNVLLEPFRCHLKPYEKECFHMLKSFAV